MDNANKLLHLELSLFLYSSEHEHNEFSFLFFFFSFFFPFFRVLAELQAPKHLVQVWGRMSQQSAAETEWRRHFKPLALKPTDS